MKARKKFAPSSLSQTRRLPKILPRDKWEWAVHPEQWRVSLPLQRVVPVLTEMPQVPGAAGVGNHGNSAQYESYGRRGWIFLALSLLPPSVLDAEGPDATYRHEVETETGITYLSIFETVEDGANRTTVDRKGLDGYAAWLVDAGHVPGPGAHVLRRLIGDVEQAIQRSGDMANPGPRQRRQREALEQQLQILEAALETVDGGGSVAVASTELLVEAVTAAPAKGKRRPKAAEPVAAEPVVVLDEADSE
jgi:hypothetical protein